jgi:UPF0716 family protein affecting phage T7 exclusion
VTTGTEQNIWKVVGGGVIICAAFAIMMPDLVKYLLGIWRFLVLVGIIFVGAGGYGLWSTRSARAKIREAKARKEALAERETNESNEVQQ